MRSRRFLIYGFLAAAWLLFGLIVLPHVIDQAYAGRSITLLNRIISGRTAHPASYYQGAWRRAFALLSAALVVVVLLVTLLPWRRVVKSIVAAGKSALQPRISIRQALMIALAVGLSSGLIEALVQSARTLLQGRPMWGVPYDYYTGGMPWMSPLANGVAFALLSLVLVAPFVLFKRGVPSRVWLVVLVTLSVYSLIASLHLRVHPAAVISLGLGVATQLARWAHIKPRPLRRQASRVAVAGLLACLLTVASATALRRPVHASGAPRKGSNVLLIVLDTQRAQELSLYGYHRKTTPNIDRFAEHAVVFDVALATAPWTLPSHASLFTGHWPSELSTNWDRRLDDRYPTIAEVFAQNGYATGAFVANEIFASPRSGLARGFQQYRGDARALGAILQNSWLTRRGLALLFGEGDHGLWRKRAKNVRQEFQEWAATTSGRPFFAFLNFMDTHSPYLAPTPYDTFFTGRRIETRPQFNRRYSQRQIRGFVDAYDQGLAYADAEIGKIIEGLGKSGVLDRTIIVITADHGELLGERRRNQLLHGETLYLAETHVPLIVSVPGDSMASGHVKHVVSLRDVAATILDLAELPNNGRIPGTALDNLWRHGNSPNVSPAYSQRQQEHVRPTKWPRALLEGDYHYIDWNGKWEVYDVSVDPWERNDLSKSIATERLQAFKARTTRMNVR